MVQNLLLAPRLVYEFILKIVKVLANDALTLKFSFLERVKVLTS